MHQSHLANKEVRNIYGIQNSTTASKNYLLAKVWYLTQIHPPPEDSVRRLNTSVSWVIWKGHIFRVPLSTLHGKKEEGGWDLINLKRKVRGLFLHRMWKQGQRSGAVKAELMLFWDLESQSNNPPIRDRIPPALGYLRRYEMNAAYVPPHGSSESVPAYKRRI